MTQPVSPDVSMPMVEAAIKAWNIAEPTQQFVGVSYHRTFSEIITAALAARPGTAADFEDDLDDLLLTALNVAENNLPKGHAQRRLANLLERARVLTVLARTSS